jgi:ArsR family transcriptional regulator
MNASWDILKALSDPTRLRLLALVVREELSVAELQEILGMGQSRISSQLAHLRQAGLVTDRREGKKAFYSLRTGLPARRLALLRAAAESVADLPAMAADRESLERILSKRRQISERYFNLIAGRLGKNYCPGRSWEAIGHLALRLVPAITVADLGAGEGLVSQLIARRATQVWCIDNSPRMVEVGAALARRNGLSNLAYRLGDIEDVPLRDKSVDLAILSQALHHAQHPQTAVNEAFRILRPGGSLVVLDLNEHSFEKARELYADVWLGFSENTLHGLLKKAGFREVDVFLAAREPDEPHFETLLASGVRPARVPAHSVRTLER